ncbi:MAG: hypothetical protein IPQ07_37430, partial [Myxococcales bacterium]|nr:hypothetical protein [Myxococcales bacterium]
MSARFGEAPVRHGALHSPRDRSGHDIQKKADAIATSAGALTTSLGGLGAHQAVSVGGGSGTRSVLIDGVPLARLSAAVTVDLGRYLPDAFGEVRPWSRGAGGARRRRR